MVADHLNSAGRKFGKSLYSSEISYNLKLTARVGGDLTLRLQCFTCILLAGSLQKPILQFRKLRPRSMKSVIQSYTLRIWGKAGNPTQVLSDFTASAASQRYLQWKFWKLWIKSSRIPSRRQITENWLLANTSWISVNTILQLMRFCRTESWGVCVWCLGLLEDTILCPEHDLESLVLGYVVRALWSHLKGVIVSIVGVMGISHLGGEVKELCELEENPDLWTGGLELD